MPSLCETPRASITACGPQHLSSARLTQSCGQSFRVMPTTSYPCASNKAAAAEESTPPLMPTTTRTFLVSLTKGQDTGSSGRCKVTEKEASTGCGCLSERSYYSG